MISLVCCAFLSTETCTTYNMFPYSAFWTSMLHNTWSRFLVQLFPWPKWESAFEIKLELSSLTMHRLLLRRSASKHTSCFHDSLSKAKCMKARPECALLTALVRALSHCFHKSLWAESAFMRCIEAYWMLMGAVKSNPAIYRLSQMELHHHKLHLL